MTKIRILKVKKEPMLTLEKNAETGRSGTGVGGTV